MRGKEMRGERRGGAFEGQANVSILLSCPFYFILFK
jgi:hypothetical protein